MNRRHTIVRNLTVGLQPSNSKRFGQSTPTTGLGWRGKVLPPRYTPLGPLHHAVSSLCVAQWSLGSRQQQDIKVSTATCVEGLERRQRQDHFAGAWRLGGLLQYLLTTSRMDISDTARAGMPVRYT